MDKRAFEDKLLKNRSAYPMCSGGCHRGVPTGLDSCWCRCHLEARVQMDSQAFTERLAAIVSDQ